MSYKSVLKVGGQSLGKWLRAQKQEKNQMNICLEMRCFRVTAILMLKFEIAIFRIFC